MEKLEIALEDPLVTKAAQSLEKAVKTFEKVRRALRFERHDGKPIHRRRQPDSSIEQAEQTEQCLQALRNSMVKLTKANVDPERTHGANIVLRYLDKYQDRLHGHLIRVPDSEQIILVQRTNNYPEHLFGRTKRGWRRRLGTKKLARRVQTAHPTELLLANLDSQQYVDLCYQGDIQKMSAVFAQHEAKAAEIRRERRQGIVKGTTHIPKRAIRQKGFFDKLNQILRLLAACYM